MRLLFTLFSVGLFCADAGAQASSDNWTLERAVDYALENNLQVRRLDYSRDLAALNLTQDRNQRLPTLNGGTGLNLQLGRTIDPVTNEFDDQRILSQGYQLQANAIVYNGGLIRNQIRRSELDLEAAELDRTITGNDISLQVANSYLTILLLREQVTNARTQLQLFDNQLANTDALIEAGSVPVGQRYDILAQQAAARRSLIDLQNQEQLAILNLQLQLDLDPREPFRVVTPTLDLSDEALFSTYNTEEVYTNAQSIQPTIRAAEVRVASADLGDDIARAGMLPTISTFASLNTNFSNVAKEFDPTGQTVGFVDTDVLFNGEVVQLGLPQAMGGSINNIPYFDQIDRNFGQSVGISLNVPIYNRGLNKLNVQRAEVQRLNALLDRDLAENNLRNDVIRALADLRAAQETYRAAQVAEEAARNAYQIAQRRYQAGAGNSLDLVTAANNFERAQTESSRTKYQLIFNREVIEFYLGRGLSLD